MITIPILSTYIYIRNPANFSQLDPRTRPIEAHMDMAELGQHSGLLELDLQSTESSETSTGPAPSTLIARDPALAARLIWGRSIVRGTALCLGFGSMARITISEFTTVNSPSAFLIGFVCWLFLGEAFGWRLRIAAGMSSQFYIQSHLWLV